MVNVILAVFAVSISIFIIQSSLRAIYNPAALKKLLLGLNNRGPALLKERRQKSKNEKVFEKNNLTADIELLLKEEGGIKIFFVTIRSMTDFYLLRIILSIATLLSFIITGFLFGKNFLFYSIAASAIVYFLLQEILKGKTIHRSRVVLRQLPDIIDLMSSLVSAGLTLEQAIYYISKNLKNTSGKLFRIYRIKIIEGKSRAEAFSIIARLSFCAEFKSFIKILHQSETIGNPIKEILSDLSRVYRNNQRDFLKMRAERIESNLIVVIFIFIFIPMLAIFLLPVIPQLKIIIG